jgi:glycosyltransferase involved in cell wall biosynthesis
MAERALHIGIDARELAGQMTGVGRDLPGILRAWSANGAAAKHRFTLISPQELPAWVRTLGPAFSTTVEASDEAGTRWEQTRLPGAAKRAGVDVWFSPGYTAPIFMRCPFVVTIHDVSFFAHPEWFGRREGIRRRWLTRLSARRARSVLTVSEFSAREIVKWTGVARTDINIAPNAAPPPHETPGPRAPIVLFVGSLFNRRRLPDMLHSFRLVREQVPDARLVLVGDNRTLPRIDPMTMAATLGIGRSVEWRDYVPDETLNEIYSQAKVFLFLSEYEGFAITPLEAIAHGVPPVMLDTPVAREVYGRAARVTLGNPQSIAEAIVELLTNPEAHERTLDAGRKLLGTYSWDRSAAVVLQALEKAAAT